MARPFSWQCRRAHAQRCCASVHSGTDGAGGRHSGGKLSGARVRSQCTLWIACTLGIRVDRVSGLTGFLNGFELVVHAAQAVLIRISQAQECNGLGPE